MPSDDRLRLERLEAAVLHLRECATGSLLLVEGIKDRRALEVLGIGGRHMGIHRGRSLAHVIDHTVERVLADGLRQVVLLTDWDRTGGRLHGRLHDGLRGRVPVDIDCRRRVAVACHARALEDVPAELAALRRRFGTPA